MKASELMIDDIVRLVYKVGTFVSKVNLDNLIDYREGKLEYEPIPLTDEMLKMNGFEDETSDFWKLRVDDKPYHYAFRLNKGGALCADGYNMNCNIYTITIKFVHELQLALRMCGLDELANNFRVE